MEEPWLSACPSKGKVFSPHAPFCARVAVASFHSRYQAACCMRHAACGMRRRHSASKSINTIFGICLKSRTAAPSMWMLCLLSGGSVFGFGVRTTQLKYQEHFSAPSPSLSLSVPQFFSSIWFSLLQLLCGFSYLTTTCPNLPN